MTAARFIQADIERLIRAARNEGAKIEMDVVNGVVTIIPDIHKPERVDRRRRMIRQSAVGNDAVDGEENWT
jgi:hypothetical protein